MKKIVIIINGNGGVGKDTLCDLAGQSFKVKSISAITPIKNIALEHGWKGEKDARARKFLSDLKRTFIDYNDLPYNYLMGEYKRFLEEEEEILFVHIREGEEIDKFKKDVKIPCITLLIRRKAIQMNWGNESDDDVEKYRYNYCYNNDKSLSDAKTDFVGFLREVMEREQKKNEKMIQEQKINGKNTACVSKKIRDILPTLYKKERESSKGMQRV